MTIKLTKELVGWHVSFLVASAHIGWKEFHGEVVGINEDLNAYEIKDDDSDKIWMVLPDDVQDIGLIMNKIEHRKMTTLKVEKTGPNWYENRDPATVSSQMPKTAKIGYQPCSVKVRDEVFQHELEKLINRHSMDADCNTPDFILAKYLMDSLKAFRTAQSNNVEWHGAESKMRRP